MFGHRRAHRGTTPIDFDRFDKLRDNLGDNEYMVLNRILPPNPAQHHYFRNALIGLGLGLGGGAMYRYRNALMRLGQKAHNYGLDKFHNLFNLTNKTVNTIPINDHDA